MPRTVSREPGITIDLIGHLLGRSSDYREWILLGLEQTPLTAFPELDDGERLLAEAMFSRSRRVYTFGAGPMQDLEPWDQSKQSYKSLICGANTPSELIKPFYSAAPRHIHLRTQSIPSEFRETFARLNGKKGEGLEQRLDTVDLEALKERLGEYPLENTGFTLGQALAFAYQKPVGEARERDIRAVMAHLKEVAPGASQFLSLDLQRLLDFETLRANLLSPAVRYVSSDRCSSEMAVGADRHSLEVKHWLSKTTLDGRNRGYDEAIARIMREDYPRVYTGSSLPSK